MVGRSSYGATGPSRPGPDRTAPDCPRRRRPAWAGAGEVGAAEHAQRCRRSTPFRVRPVLPAAGCLWHCSGITGGLFCDRIPDGARPRPGGLRPSSLVTCDSVSESDSAGLASKWLGNRDSAGASVLFAHRLVVIQASYVADWTSSSSVTPTGVACAPATFGTTGVLRSSMPSLTRSTPAMHSKWTMSTTFGEVASEFRPGTDVAGDGHDGPPDSCEPAPGRAGTPRAASSSMPPGPSLVHARAQKGACGTRSPCSRANRRWSDSTGARSSCRAGIRSSRNSRFPACRYHTGSAAISVRPYPSSIKVPLLVLSRPGDLPACQEENPGRSSRTTGLAMSASARARRRLGHESRRDER